MNSRDSGDIDSNEHQDIDLVAQSNEDAAVSQPNSVSRTHKRRILLSGFAILALSFIAGIILSFYQWDRGSPFDLSNWNDFNPIGRATYGPVVFAVILFPISIPLLVLVSVLIWVGMKKQRLWPLSLISFIGLGLLWLWYITELWQFD